jgi:hypothetical protein
MNEMDGTCCMPWGKQRHLFDKPANKRPLDKCRLRWQNNKDTNLRVTGYGVEDRIQMDQNMAHLVGFCEHGEFWDPYADQNSECRGSFLRPDFERHTADSSLHFTPILTAFTAFKWTILLKINIKDLKSAKY